MADTQRYWNGERWTDFIAPGTPSPQPEQLTDQQRQEARSWWTTNLLLTAVLPIVGFIIGIVQVKKNVARGGTLIGVAIVLTCVYGAVIESLTGDGEGPSSTTSYEADAAVIERQIDDYFTALAAGETAMSVTCPEGVAWKVGKQFRCDLRASTQGVVETAEVVVTMENDEGDVTFAIDESTYSS